MDTIVAFYDNVAHAQQAAKRLVALGLEPAQVYLVVQEAQRQFDAVEEAAAAAPESPEGDVWRQQGPVAREEVEQGGALVAAQTDAIRSNEVVAALPQLGLVEVTTVRGETAGQILKKAAPGVTGGDFWIDVEASIRRHFEANYAPKGYTYQAYEPAYRFGFARAVNEPGASRGWDEALPQLRQAWQKRQHGDWEQYLAAIRHGWRLGRGQIPEAEPDVSEVQTTERGAQYRELSEEQ